MYDFNDLLKSTSAEERDLAERIKTMHKALDLVVNSKSTYLNSALSTEDSKVDALIDIVGYCKNVVDDIWKTYDVDNKRHITR
mgnify:CR=1 FL=1|jgi:hypothetical protein